MLLTGPLGTGKTVFAKGVAEGLGVDVPVISPTFNIMREYVGRVRLVHADAYRLERLQEWIDLGWDEVAPDVVTLVEWGEIVSTAIPAQRCEVQFEFGSERDRNIEFRFHGESWRARRQSFVTALENEGIDHT